MTISPEIVMGVNVRARGEDVRAGTVVVAAGSVLRPQEIGVVASLGLRQIVVSQRPRVALLSTGDEVAEPGRPRARKTSLPIVWPVAACSTVT